MICAICGAQMYLNTASDGFNSCSTWVCPQQVDHAAILTYNTSSPKSNYEQLTEEELAFHKKKNHDYAGTGRENGNFERVAAIFALYPGLKLSDPKVVAIAYAMKQLDCALWSLATGNELQTDSLDERFKDAHVYFKICRCLLRDEGKA